VICYLIQVTVMIVQKCWQLVVSVGGCNTHGAVKALSIV
jgi:hypothetical protein